MAGAIEIKAQWIQATGLPGGPIGDLVSVDNSHFVAMGGRIYRSDTEGVSWIPLTSPAGDIEVTSMEAVEGLLLAGTSKGVYCKTWNMEDWRGFERPGLPKVPALSMWAYLGSLYIGSEGSVYQSIDHGATWNETQSGLPSNARVTCFAGIVKIAVAGSANRGIFITESRNWISPPNFDSRNDSIRELEAFGNRVYAISTQEVLESTNLGADWGPSSLTLPNTKTLLGVDTVLYAGTDQGIHMTFDKGKTWYPFSEGLPDKATIHSLVDLGGNLFASTDSGVWKAAYPAAGIMNPAFRTSRRPSGSILHRFGWTIPTSYVVFISHHPTRERFRRVNALGQANMFPEPWSSP